MLALKLFLGKYLTAIEIALFVLVLAFGVLQTVRLEHAHTDIVNLNATAAKLQAQREQQRADDERYARAVEGQLRDTAAAIQKESHDQEQALQSRVAGLLGQLRNRPERPAPGSPAAAASAPSGGATGAGLYREDGQFLAREAASAALIGAERDACRQQYEAAEEALKKYETERAKQ